MFSLAKIDPFKCEQIRGILRVFQELILRESRLKAFESFESVANHFLIKGQFNICAVIETLKKCKQLLSPAVNDTRSVSQFRTRGIPIVLL